MHKSVSGTRRLIVALNLFSVVLVIAGLINYFFAGHNYVQSQYYLLGAIACLAVVAILGWRKRRFVSEPHVTQERADLRDIPLWLYLYVAFCIGFELLIVNTSILRPLVFTVVAEVLVVAGLLRAIFDRFKSISSPNSRLRRVQWLGIIIGSGTAILIVLQLYVIPR